jgi:hypothetical protein
MPRQNLGILIGSGFGLIYVLVNAGPLPAGPAWSLRVAAALAFLAIVVIALRSPDAGSAAEQSGLTPAGQPRRASFGFYYRIVVAAEVIIGVAGLRVINGPLHSSQIAVAWVSLVVGVHFVALAFVWRQPVFHLLGATVAGCGLLGFALALLLGSGADRVPIAVVSGVLPGAVLLAGGWLGLAGYRRVPADRAA